MEELNDWLAKTTQPLDRNPKSVSISQPKKKKTPTEMDKSLGRLVTSELCQGQGYPNFGKVHVISPILSLIL